MSTERRPLLYQRQSRLSRQPSPERIGKVRSQYSGSSSHIQTVINSINVLVGIGLLSLPLAMRYAGWFPGLILLTFSAAITGYAAKALARCLDTDESLKTYVDVAGASFGIEGQVVTSILFSLNMIAACVAFVILFGDTMALLVPSLSITEWKIVCGVIVLPMQFVSFRVLAPVSVIGIFSCIGVVVVTITAGLVKRTTPGSLHEPARTTLMPESWFSLIASIGLFMSPWGANASFPTFYRDMKVPQTYNRSLGESFTIAIVIDIAMAASGYLMFGAETVEEVTYNILSLSPDSYPHTLLVWLIGLTAIMPITKMTLSSRPLVTMIEDVILSKSDNENDQQLGVIEEDTSSIPSESIRQPQNPLLYHGFRILLRFLVVALIVGVSVVVPEFDRVISLMGSGLCYTISIVLPLMFHVRLLRKELSRFQKTCDYVLIAVSCVLAVLGTSAALMN